MKYTLTSVIFRQNREGYTFSKTSVGDLFLGSVHAPIANESIYMRDTPENREYLNELFDTYNFSRELKKNFIYDVRK